MSLNAWVALAIGMTAIMALASGPSAAAAEQDSGRIPTTELRVLGGMVTAGAPALGLAVEGAASLGAHRVRLELDALGNQDAGWVDGAVLVRVFGSPDNALWVRGGAGLQRIANNCGDAPDHTDDAQTLDAGLAYRRRFVAGQLVAAEAGIEYLRRDSAFFCNDSVVRARSVGPRFALSGQWPLTPAWGIFARTGLRMTDHVIEVHVLPEALVGLAFEL